jgi:hypothetical protein
MVWLSWWLDASILAQKSEITQLNFPQTSTPKLDCCKTYSSWIPNPNLDHPKSSMGCIKWIGVVEKQWFGSHDGWMPQFWLKNQNLSNWHPNSQKYRSWDPTHLFLVS